MSSVFVRVCALGCCLRRAATAGFRTLEKYRSTVGISCGNVYIQRPIYNTYVYMLYIVICI